MKHKIKYYPVENGDTTLITLTDNATILTDCKLRAGATDPDDDSKYNVKADLLKSIQRKDDNPYVDAFILTHGDKDHCHGFGTNFYLGDPASYGKANRDKNEIIIGELWVTSALFTYDHCEDGNTVRCEANRRIKMRDENHTDKDKPGNRIFLIGYDSADKFKNVPSYIPGSTVTSFNGSTKWDFEIFIHGPFKDDLVQGKADKDRNSTSIVFLARFKFSILDPDFSCRALFAGDADHYIMEQVLKQSKLHGNEDCLKYNLLLAPHHCSWTFFNDVSYDIEANQTPKKSSLDILSYKLPGAYIIASSRKIVNEKPNPPHYPAKIEYVKAIGSADKFLSTAIHPEEDAPEPIEFIVERDGPMLVKVKAKDDVARNILLTISQKADKPFYSVSKKPSLREMRLRKLDRDVEQALTQFPSLQRIERDGKLWLTGTLEVGDKTGHVVQTFNVTIGFPDAYPYRYPRVTENEEKIPREADRHVYEDYTLCIAAPPIEIVNCKAGITISWFIKEKLIPHLAAQEYRNRFNVYPWGEMPHDAEGIKQAYIDICGTNAWQETEHLLRLVIDNNLPGRNDPCICNPDIKFKNCHHSKGVADLNTIGRLRLQGDLNDITNR